MQFLKNQTVRSWLLALVILLQVACILLYPFGVRRMVEIGVRQSGIRYATPKVMREQTLEDLRLFMPAEDYKTAHDAYTIENGVCTLNDRSDLAELNRIFAAAERLYLRIDQKGANSMAAVRVAMENGTMTQTQLLQAAREGLNEDLTPAQETLTAIAFLRSEYSVLGMDPGEMRTSYLRHWTWALIGCAVLMFLASLLENRLRKEAKTNIIPENVMVLPICLGTFVLALCGVFDLAGGWVKPGALALAAVALTQLVMTLLPASLFPKKSPRKPADRHETIISVVPSALSCIGAILAMIGVNRAAKGILPVNAGLNRVLANTGTTDTAALRAALIPGILLIALGICAIILARKLDQSQSFSLSGPVRSALEIAPGIVSMIAVLILVFTKRIWLGLLLLVALAASVGLMALVQNKRPERVGPMVRLPGHIACAATAGIASSLAAKSMIDLAGLLTCVIGTVIFTRTAAKLLTRR